MRKNIFNSKKLYIANIVISAILFIISALSLYALLFFEKYALENKSHSLEIALYAGYIIIYSIALILLFVKPAKAVKSLGIMYFLAFTLNFYDFTTHYSKQENNESRYLLIAVIILFAVIFSLLIYLNNKRKFIFDMSELETIGNNND